MKTENTEKNEIVYDTSFQAVDCVIYKRETDEYLVGRKKDEKFWRFVGGFVDTKDSNLEYAARRESIEEAGFDLECSYPKYLGSFRVDDPRYRDSRHKVMSAVFEMYVLWGFAKAGDDIAEVKYISESSLRNAYKFQIMKEHWPIVEMIFAKKDQYETNK